MILVAIVGLLALTAIVATVRAVVMDGYRRIPNAPIARRVDLMRP